MQTSLRGSSTDIENMATLIEIILSNKNYKSINSPYTRLLAGMVNDLWPFQPNSAG